MSDNYCLVLCTCPNDAVARQLADTIVGEKLAACANLLPGILSVYPWKDRIETSEETLLLIKTRKAAYPDLERHIQAHHPYELPEIIAVPIEYGEAAYLQWIRSWLDSKN